MQRVPLVFLAVATALGCGPGEPAAPPPRVLPRPPPVVATAAPPPVDIRPGATHPTYPATRKEDVKDVLFGTEVKDPYRWLEDEKSLEVQRWMTEQDAVARDYLAKLPGRDAI